MQQHIRVVPPTGIEPIQSWIQAAAAVEANCTELYKRFTPQVLNAVVAGNTQWDMQYGGYAQLLMGAGNTTMNNPFNTFNGGMFCLEVVQDSVGSRLVTWGSNFIWAAGTAPTLTITANKRDFINFICANGLLYGQAILNFA